MKKGVREAGYTIVETMIFLAVSGALLISALFLINGQQQKTEFTTSVRDFDSKLQDIINNINTGYYTNSGNIKCQAGRPGMPPHLSVNPIATDLQGQNTGCIYVGQVIQFTKSSLNIFSMAGNRLTTGSPPQCAPPSQFVTDLVCAWPMAIANGTNAAHNGPPPPAVTAGPDSTETYSLNSLEITKVVYYTGSIINAPPKTDAIGFFTTFVPYSGPNQLSGSTGTQVIALTNRTSTAYNTPTDQMVDKIDNALRTDCTNFASTTPITTGCSDLQNGIKICLKSLSTSQYTVVSLGGSGNITTKVDIYGSAAAADAAQNSKVCTLP